MISVFTAAYNRAGCLPRLFESLRRQTNQDFEWIVVDDGSGDATAKAVEGFIAESPFPIRYAYQDNAGKHAAWNAGLSLARGQWFFAVDSDDWLPDTALETVQGYLTQLGNAPEVAGIAGNRQDPQGNLLVRWSRGRGIESPVDRTFAQVRYQMGIKGDNAEVVRTSVLKRYPFPRFPGEKFLSEAALWLAMSRDGLRLRWVPDVIYCGEYLEGGLTRTRHASKWKDCRGKAYCENLKSSLADIPWTKRLKAAVRCLQFSAHAGMAVRDYLGGSATPRLAALLLPLFWVQRLLSGRR